MLPILREQTGCEDWSFGGGTALAIHLDHRLSKDIDIFLAGGVRVLWDLSPSTNLKTRAITDRWQFARHYVKLELPEGEIDFLLSHRLLPSGLVDLAFEESLVPLETLAEIAAKKLFWHGSQLKVRDLFDLAAIADSDRSAFQAAAELVRPDTRRWAAIRHRASLVARAYREQVIQQVTPTAGGMRYMTEAPDILRDIGFVTRPDDPEINLGRAPSAAAGIEAPSHPRPSRQRSGHADSR